MSKVIIITTIIFLSLLASGATVYFIANSDSFSVASVSSKYIERPIFKYVKCEAVGSLKYSQDYSLADAGEWINTPSVTDKFDVKLKFDYSIFKIMRISYNVCNSKVLSNQNCNRNGEKQQITGNTFEINNIQNGQQVYLKYEEAPLSFLLPPTKKSKPTYNLAFIPYGLREYDVLSGSANQINPNDCTVTSSDKSWNRRIISSDSEAVNNKVPSKNINELTLQPEEVRWYLSGYVSAATPSILLTYKNQDAWCRTTGDSAELYKINEITIGDGTTYSIASTDWSDHLGTESCCPGQTRGNQVCQPDFRYKDIESSKPGTGTPGSESFQSCGSPNPVPYSEKKTIQYYKDSNGVCQSKITNVECASDYDCKDANKVCNLNTYKCVNANINLEGQKIKTLEESQTNCEAKGGVWYPPSTTTSGIIFKSKTENPGICRYPHISIFSILLILLGLGVLIFSIIKSQPIGAVFGGAIALVGAIWAIIAGMGIL